MERGLAIHAACRQRPVRRALHPRVNIGFVPLVERTGSTGAKRDAQNSRKAQNGMDCFGRRQQTTEPCEDDKRHHTGLGQREKIAPVSRKAF